MGFLLFVISIVLSVILYSIAIPYTIIKYFLNFKFKTALKYIDNILFMIAYSIDKLGNVVLGPIMNDLILKRKYYISSDINVLDKEIELEIVNNQIKVVRFGNPNQTISTVLGHNKNIGNIKQGWVFIPNVLDYFDPNHCLNAAKYKFNF